LINAPDVWGEGINGEGVVIGGQDTGYDWQHPALIEQYRGWDGSTTDHNYNWHDAIHEDKQNAVNDSNCVFDSPEPCDDHGHGTHTMGTMVGDDHAGNQIGVAPGAKWIACRNMNHGVGTPATYSECYQWFIAPYPHGGDPLIDGDPSKAPHVINNSWSCPPSEGCVDPDILREVVENVRAAGIITVQAASNGGPSCGTINSPAAIYDASYSVGATDNSDRIAGFSSRGPVSAGDNNPAKPDISAPGVSIRSSQPGDTYGYSSGTSMAAPHVVGLIALLINTRPDLAGDVTIIEDSINQSAVPQFSNDGCAGDTADSRPNHTYGWGRIDAWQAYQAIIEIGNPEYNYAYTPAWMAP
jgi:subtilisin family serine protease